MSIDQILPSLQSLGVLDYWLIGLAALLEGFFVTGVVIPGTLVVDAGGILVQRGLLDFFDLVWFAALGAALGGEASYWTGRLARGRLGPRMMQSRALKRAEDLFARRGGFALVLGRFLGPVSGLAPLAAALAGMERRRFLLWNLAGSLPYALVHVGMGWAAGDVLGRIGPAFTRAAVALAIFAAALALVWWLLYRAFRLLPLVLGLAEALVQGLTGWPPLRRLLDRHPRLAAWGAARLARGAFTGLPLTLLGLVFVYALSVWADSVLHFMTGGPLLSLDQRLAELAFHLRAPVPVAIATQVTALGSWPTVWAVCAAAVLWLLSERRLALALGLVVSTIGGSWSVALLKLVFQRPRSALGVYLESSDSFPSGHAGASVAFWGMLMFVLWRAGRLRAETALLAAGLFALAIGGSRIYLVEHYLTDVWNGWLVGGLWLMVGVAIAGWWQEGHPPADAPRPGGGLVWAARIAALALVVVALIAAGAVVALRPGPAGSAPLAIGSAAAFDPPPGDGTEHDDQAAFAIDDDPTTAWTSESYRDPVTIAGKGGVGLVLTLDATGRVDGIDVQSAEGGWDASVYATTGDRPADLAGWGEPLAATTSASSGTTALRFRAVEADAVLVWFTRLPSSGAVSVSRVTVRGR
ncbi:MAG: bifunctional DedA family/phosphatase PAP2 family protein [Acidimicrobiales bacterium]|nr:bifunctional DedA family/phosphatase PAP2 family protein [Acidimicrobiales bacterium]